MPHMAETPDVLETIRRRVSVRGYTGRPVEPQLLDRLVDLAATQPQCEPRLTGLAPRIILVSGVEQVHRLLTFVVGSYGLIQNPPHLLVGVLPENSDLARLELGYILEHIVLEATGLGLGTVWITGSYAPKRTEAAVELQPGETVAAVCALGYAADSGIRQLHSTLAHRLVGGRRLPLHKLTHAGRWGQTWVAKAADARLVAVLEAARIAPSAANLQPWRFIVHRDGIVLALARWAPIDAGIAMAHVTLASRAVGLGGRWHMSPHDVALSEACALPPSVSVVGEYRFDQA